MPVKAGDGRTLMKIATRPNISPWICRAVAVAAAAVMLLRLGLTIPQFTNAWDEPFNIAAAVGIYDMKKHVMNTEHPPVVPLVAGLWLHLSGVHLPPQFRSTAVVSGQTAVSAYCGFAFDGALPYREMLLRARLAMLLFPALSLLYLYLLAAWISNEGVAMWSVLFFSTDATLLGHGIWVGTDGAACAGFLIAIYYGIRWVVHRQPRQAVWAGIALGFAVGCKFSNLFVLPSLGLIMAIRPLSVVASNVPHKWRTYWRRWPSIGQMTIVAVVAAITIWAIYLFNIDRVGRQTVFPPDHWAKVPAPLREAVIPMPSFFLGIAKQASHTTGGHEAYLNGQVSMRGWWYYYPEALAIKSPTALLIGLFIAVAAIAVSVNRGIWRVVVLAIPPAVYLLAAIRGHIDIGVRLILPAIPFLYLIICMQMAGARRWMATTLAVLVAFSFVETLSVHPNYLGFFNVLVGGPGNGARYLGDSNIDWGQDLGQLAQWLKSEPQRNRPYTLDLFCNPDPELVRYLGLDESAIVLAPGTERSGLLAVSVKGLQAGPEDQWLHQYPLVKHIGKSIDVFDLGPTKVPIPVHRRVRL